MTPAPTKIKLAGENDTLRVEWSDGHVSAYPYRYLRDKCPCATCAGRPAYKGPAPSPLPLFGEKPLKPARVEPVGRYALQIFWNDGHSSGIYSFQYLRELCPCAECRAEREPA
jgi:DUF971 family protein